MFQMWRLMDWRVYCYDKISHWKANLMAISNSRILWSKVMLQINSGGRPSLSRFTSRVFHERLLRNRLKGGNIYLFIYPSIHTSTIYISVLLHCGPWALHCSLVNQNVPRLSDLTFFDLSFCNMPSHSGDTVVRCRLSTSITLFLT